MSGITIAPVQASGQSRGALSAMLVEAVAVTPWCSIGH